MRCSKRRRFFPLLPGGGRREWDALPSDILIQIFYRMSYFDLFTRLSCVCRSWRSAILDTVFSFKMGVLDLRRVDNLFPFLRRLYLRFLHIFLDSRGPNYPFLKIHFPCSIRLKEEAIFYIAQRTPSVQYVDAGNREQRSYVMALQYWKNLKGFTCRFSFLYDQLIVQVAYRLRIHCKSTSYLTLFGRIRVKEASAIVKNLPNLKELTLDFSSVTVEALLILDGHKKLEKLNLRHTIFVDENKILNIFHGETVHTTRIAPSFGEGAKDWTEDIRDKVAGNKVYLRCEGRVCRKCCWAYQLKSCAVS